MPVMYVCMFQCIIYLCETMERLDSDLSDLYFTCIADHPAVLESMLQCVLPDEAVITRLRGMVHVRWQGVESREAASVITVHVR